MITREQWGAVSARAFERLALEHVRELYPNVGWVITAASGDGGKDAVGKVVDLRTGIEEIYWMEAKNRAYIDHYTIGPHLFTVVAGNNVQCLHAVGSGHFSSKFIIRAKAFAADQGLRFSYSDGVTLTAWLARHPEFLRAFGPEQRDVKRALKALTITERGLDGIFASGFIVPESDAFRSEIDPAAEMLPGLRYTLVVTLTRAFSLPPNALPLKLTWRPPPDRISVLHEHVASTGVEVTDLSMQAAVAVTFRVLGYSAAPLPEPVITRADTGRSAPVPLRPAIIVDRLTAPFVGQRARELAIRAKQRLSRRDEDRRPVLLCYWGRAGTGKSRLAEEIRDDGHLLGYDVRMLPFSPNVSEQETQWRRLFCWLFGLANNLFAFKDSDLLDRRLTRLGHVRIDAKFRAALAAFLIDGTYSERLFDPGDKLGVRMLDVVDRTVHASLGRLLIHLDDAHHLSERTIAPLRFFKHLIATSQSLPLVVIVTSRDDETVVRPTVSAFYKAVDLERSPTTVVEEVPEFRSEDARELVKSVLRVPEGRATHSRLMEMIVDRAGTNAFAIMQLLHYLIVEESEIDKPSSGRPVLTIARGGEQHLVAVDTLKKRLRAVPPKIKGILDARFASMREKHRRLFHVLLAAALFGRHAPTRIVESAIGRSLAEHDVRELFRLGYLADAGDGRLVLAHDLLVERLQDQADISGVARRLVTRLGTAIKPEKVGDERLAAIYLFAGDPYLDKSFQHADRAVRAADAAENHRGVLGPFAIIRKVCERDRNRPRIADDLHFIAAIADQHCGNTGEALGAFLNLIASAAERMGDPAARKLYIDCAIEAGNQTYHLLRLTEAMGYIDEAINQLGATDQPFDEVAFLGRRSLAYNRAGAVLQVAGRDRRAEACYRRALQDAEEGGAAYMVSHTLADLASLLRARDARQATALFARARAIQMTTLADKRRLRIMLDISELFSACLLRNTHPQRLKLYSAAAEAMQHGFSSLASDALTCQGVCANAVGAWDEAEDVLLRVLDVGTVMENQRTRLFAYHYLAVTQAGRAHFAAARDANDQAQTLMADPLFARSALERCLRGNDRLLRSRKRPRSIPFNLA